MLWHSGSLQNAVGSLWVNVAVLLRQIMDKEAEEKDSLVDNARQNCAHLCDLITEASTKQDLNNRLAHVESSFNDLKKKLGTWHWHKYYDWRLFLCMDCWQLREVGRHRVYWKLLPNLWWDIFTGQKTQTTVGYRSTEGKRYETKLRKSKQHKIQQNNKQRHIEKHRKSFSLQWYYGVTRGWLPQRIRGFLRECAI